MLNLRGEPVGELIFKDKELCYITTRNAKNGHIFSRKTKFNGRTINNGVAIDVAILKKLFAHNVKSLIFHIQHFESQSFYGMIDLYQFMEKSESICYDRDDLKHKYGKQRVVGMDELERVKI